MIRIIKWLSVVLILSAIFCTETRANTITAATCSQTDVANAVSQAAAGDTVVIPACASGVSWTTTLTVSKGITLQGQGIGQTVLIDNVPKGNSSCGGAAPMLSVSGSTFFRVTGFTLQGSAPDTYVCQPGHLTISGSSQSFRVDHIAFANQQTVGIRTSGTLWGVIDHCAFQGGHKNGILVENSGYGDSSWASPTNLGSQQFIFVETNTFTDPSAVGAGAIDVDGGGRVVFRYNTASFIATHGTETSGRFRGVRAFEIYNNTFTAVQNSQYTAIFIRGGTGVVYNNAFNNSGTNNYVARIIVDNYRDHQPYTPWGQCDGTSSYDQNSQTGYACIDQVGRGVGGMLSGNPATPASWPNQAREPMYQWGNTGAGNQSIVSHAAHIQPGRDYYDNTNMPGYTAYPYPHPLTVSGTPPAPPTGLQAIVN